MTSPNNRHILRTVHYFSVVISKQKWAALGMELWRVFIREIIVEDVLHELGHEVRVIVYQTNMTIKNIPGGKDVTSIKV